VGTDKYGNVYLTGRFAPDYNYTTGTTYGCVFSKYTSGGMLLWTDTVYNVREIHSVVDSLGNIYATGYFRYNVTFGNNTYYANGYCGGFIVKYNTNGQVLWSKNTYGFSIGVSKNQGIYVGSTNGGSGDTSGTQGGLISKYSNSGILLWDTPVFVKNKGGLGYCRINALSVDKHDNVYLTGQYKDTIILGTGSNTAVLIYNGPYQNNFVAKYNSTGDFQWVKVDANPSYGFEQPFVYSISTDSFGNSIITGSFYNTLTFGATTYSAGNNVSVLLAQYDPNGNLNWQKAIMGTSNTYAYAITQDKAENFYIAGYIDGQTNFGNGISGGSNWDAYVVKYDKNGTAQWLAASSQVGNGGGANGYGVCVDDSRNVYMVGAVSGSNVVFGNTSLSTPITYYSDMFLTQIKDSQVNGLFEVKDFLDGPDFNLYPNPCIDHFTITSTVTKTAYITITNILGQCVYSKHCKPQGELHEQIQMSTYPKGIYLVEVSTEKGKEIRKIVLD
jgi:hypothetical protein